MFKVLTEDEFTRRAANAGRVAVFREFLADRETPVAAFSRLGADEEAFLLESVSGGETRGRYSYLGIDPRAKVEGEGALDELRRLFAEKPYAPAPELPSFQGGAVGYVSYDAVKTFEPKVGERGTGNGERGTGNGEPGTPCMAFLVCDTFLVFDNVRDTVTIVVVSDVASYPTPHDAYAAATAKIDATYERMLSAESISRLMAEHRTSDVGSRTSDSRHPATGEFKSEMTREEFRAIVENCKEAIRSGEVIQIVPSQKFTATTRIPALALYRALRLVNPSPYDFFLRIGGKTLIGSSPEELVRLENGIGSISPIAGTRPRGKTPAEDRALEAELRADPKELAEHMMLVDLARNDLGRVAKTGTVKVENLAHVERYSHVMHLVTRVTGELEPGKESAERLFRAAFPAGTLTGAPKIRAMELLAEFEKSPRGVYGGAAGYYSNTGDMNFAIVIRTMVLEDGVLTMRSGAGIVADSDPEREYDETVNKAKAVFEAAKFAEELQ